MMLEVNKIHLGNNLALLKQMSDNSVDSVVTDPPYGWSFMGKKWDYDVPTVELWREVYRVLKPGGHALVACGTRTQHRMAVNIEDAGFEIRDIVAWVYGSGFPKSKNIGLAIDKINGIESKVISNGKSGKSSHAFQSEENTTAGEYEIKEAQNQYQGFGTALKPAMELWTLARKPIKGTVAENVLKYGVGGLNIDGCRVGTEEIGGGSMPNLNQKDGMQGIYNGTKIGAERLNYDSHIGRFPANFIHDGSDEVIALFPDGADRFFYTAKANKTERDMGLYGFEYATDNSKGNGLDRVCEFCGAPQLNPALCKCETKSWITKPRRNTHPTVKPLDLMRYLCRLITPPNGIVLDPYIGSGTTAVAAKLEGFRYIGMEQEPDYVEIAVGRVAECDRDYETKAEMLADENVKEVFDIFDFIEG